MGPRKSTKLADGQQAAIVTTALQQKFWTTRDEMNAAMIEREDEVEMILSALICNEHPLFVGPPGAGKTMMAEAIASWMSNGQKFYILMTKFTQMEELFGPLDMVALQNSRYLRITKGRLPEAHIAILDEIWKSSSAILNTNLRALNEGVFENDGQLLKIPLMMAIACSNEWPGDSDSGKELGALMDRFLFRKNVKPIASPAGRKRLLWTPDHTPVLSTTITPDEIRQARKEAMTLPWQQGAMDTMERILTELKKDGIVPGDRRQYKAVAATRAYAYLCGADEVEQEHLEILRHVLWNDPVEQPEKCSAIVRKLANPQGAQISGLLLEAQTIVDNMNMSDLKDVLTSSKKLQEIEQKLDSMKNSDRQKTALEYVRDNIKQIKVAAISKSLA